MGPTEKQVPSMLTLKVRSQKMHSGRRNRELGQFIEKAFMPHTIEGLTHIQQDSACRQLLVSGVRQLRDGTDELESHQVILAKPRTVLCGWNQTKVAKFERIFLEAFAAHSASET